MSQLGVVHHVSILTVHRHEVLRSKQLVECAQLTLTRVAGSVDRLVTGMDHLGRGAVEVVDDATDRPLVAGYRVGTEDRESFDSAASGSP